MSSTTNSAITRRLAAILIADVVGYTRLMERDDTGTFSRLRSIRDEVVDPAIISHDGRIVKTAGDGLLAEFPSALAALRASVQIQSEMAKRNEGVAADERIDYRIGVNLGDIMVDGSDIVGDGVNVASRLESLAEPGGICVSGPVHDQVHGNLDVGFDDIGEQQVKNIARPIRAFVVRLGGAGAFPAGGRAVPKATTIASLALPPRRNRLWVAFAVVVGVGALVFAAAYFHLWPLHRDTLPTPPAMSVGVLPLVAPGGDPATAQRVGSITRDMISQLALADVAIRAIPITSASSDTGNTRGTSELARSFNVRYLLEGNVQSGPGVTEIRLRLVNGASAEQVWSETVPLKDPPAATDQARSLRLAMEHLRSRLYQAEMRRVAAESDRATTAMDFVLRAQSLDQGDRSLDRLRREEALYEEALRRDPDLVPALLGILNVFDGRLDMDSNIDRETLIRHWDEVSTKAVNLNRAAPETWAYRSGALMLMGRWDAALEAGAKAMELDPYAAWLVAKYGWSMSMVGRPADAVALVAKATAMDPPGDWWTIRMGCEAYLLLGQYDDAIKACEKASGLGGEDFDIAYFLAAAYAQRGQMGRAAEERAKILRKAPGFTIATLRAKQYSTHPEYMRLAEEHWYSGLRKAGIPEK